MRMLVRGEHADQQRYDHGAEEASQGVLCDLGA